MQDSGCWVAMVVVVEVDGSSDVLLKLSKPCGVCLCVCVVRTLLE